jgi:serine/threonine protein kinase
LKKFILEKQIPIFRPIVQNKVNLTNEIFIIHCQNSVGKDKEYLVKETTIPSNRNVVDSSFQTNTNNIKEFLHSILNSKYIQKQKGYYIENDRYYFIYKHHNRTLKDIMNENNIDFVNKIKIFKMLLELVKSLHIQGIVSLQLSPENIKFTRKNVLKHSLSSSIDFTSDFHLESFFILKNDEKSVYTPPEIYLNQPKEVSWHSDIWSLGVLISLLFSYEMKIDKKSLRHYYISDKIPRNVYKYVDNIFIQSIILGILKVDPFERPNIFEIIDNYNNLIRLLKSQSDSFSSDYYIINIKEEYISNNI